MANRLLLVILILSVLLNAALARAVLQDGGPPTSASTARAPASDRSEPVSPPRSVDGDPENLRTSSTALIAFENEAYASARALADRYWQSDGRYERALGQALFDAEEEIRTSLLERFGPAAARNPMFRAHFRPLDPVYAFLSSAQQLAVERLRFERDAALQASMRGGARLHNGASPDSPGAVDAAAVAAATKAYRAGLEAALDEPTLFEFLLRDSPTAQQLRSSGVMFTEHEFRDAFAALSDLPEASDDIEGLLAVRDRLREILGSERAAAFWASRDPMFAELERIAARNGIDAGTVDATYELMSEFQDRKMRLAQTAGNDPFRAADESRRLANDEHDAIARLVGDEAAGEIRKARAVQSFRLFGRDSKGP